MSSSLVMFTCTSKAPERPIIVEEQPKASTSLKKHKTVDEDVQDFTSDSKTNMEPRLQTEEVIRALGVYRKRLESEIPNKPAPVSEPPAVPW
jgi:hypothetical protein